MFTPHCAGGALVFRARLPAPTEDADGFRRCGRGGGGILDLAGDWLVFPSISEALP